MDQEQLVIEQIEAGEKFIDELEKHVRGHAAFWHKASEDSGWYLYVASDQVTDQKIRAAYGEVGRVSETIHDPNFDPFRVKLIGVADPFARAALDHYRRSPAEVPTHIWGRPFGSESVEGVYLYPPPASPPAE